MERTNVTNSGYTYNGQRFVNEERVDSQGNKYTVAVPTAISASALLSTPQKELQVLQPKYDLGSSNAGAANASSYIQSVLDREKQLEDFQLRRAEDEYLRANSDVGRLQAQLIGGREGIQQQQYDVLDATGQSINTRAGKIRALAARSQALSVDTQARQQAEINKATGQNITRQAVQRNTADATRENFINQAQIAVETAILNADFETAKSFADRMVDAKYNDKLEEIEIAKTNLKNAEFLFTREEKKIAERTLERKERERREYEDRKAEEKQINELLINAASQGAPKEIIDRATKGKTAKDTAIALGAYAGDYRRAMLLEEQIKTERAQRGKIYASMQPTATGEPGRVQSLYDLTQDLLTAGGKGGAVGFGLKKNVFSVLPGIDQEAIAGTDRAAYEAKVKQLQSALTLDNLDKMKGVLTDKDIEVLRTAATALSLDMPEKDFDKELRKIQKIMVGKGAISPPEFQTITGDNVVDKAIRAFKSNWQSVNFNQIDYEGYLQSF